MKRAMRDDINIPVNYKASVSKLIYANLNIRDAIGFITH